MLKLACTLDSAKALLVYAIIACWRPLQGPQSTGLRFWAQFGETESKLLRVRTSETRICRKVVGSNPGAAQVCSHEISIEL